MSTQPNPTPLFPQGRNQTPRERAADFGERARALIVRIVWSVAVTAACSAAAVAVYALWWAANFMLRALGGLS